MVMLSSLSKLLVLPFGGQAAEKRKAEGGAGKKGKKAKAKAVPVKQEPAPSSGECAAEHDDEWDDD